MQTQSTSFTGNSQSGSFAGALKDSLVEVGATAALGGAAGAIGGKIAVLKPYKPSETAMNFQYADMFEKAVQSDETPEYVKSAKDELKTIIKDGRDSWAERQALGKRIIENDTLQRTIENSGNEFSKEVTDEAIGQAKTILKNGGIEADGELTKDAILDGLKKINEEAKGKHAEISGLLEEKSGEFVKQAGKSTDGKVKEIAEKGAKHLRDHCLKGAFIAVGVLGALILNCLRINGVIGKKKQTAAPAQGSNSAQVQTTAPAQGSKVLTTA